MKQPWSLFKDQELKLEFGKDKAKAWELYQTLCKFVGGICWDFLCIFALCCWGRKSNWIFLAFVLIPFSYCRHYCRKFPVLSILHLWIDFFFINVPWWWGQVNGRQDHLYAPSGQCYWTYSDMRVMTSDIYSLVVIQVQVTLSL